LKYAIRLKAILLDSAEEVLWRLLPQTPRKRYLYIGISGVRADDSAEEVHGSLEESLFTSLFYGYNL
jgi:hypothetical protein